MVIKLFRRRLEYRPSSEQVRKLEANRRNNRNMARYFERRFQHITGRTTAELHASARNEVVA